MLLRHVAIFSAFVMSLMLSEVLTAMAEPARPTGYEIMDRVYGRAEGNDRDGTITMTLTNSRGTKKFIHLSII